MIRKLLLVFVMGLVVFSGCAKFKFRKEIRQARLSIRDVRNLMGLRQAVVFVSSDTALADSGTLKESKIVTLLASDGKTEIFGRVIQKHREFSKIKTDSPVRHFTPFAKLDELKQGKSVFAYYSENKDFVLTTLQGIDNLNGKYVLDIKGGFPVGTLVFTTEGKFVGFVSTVDVLDDKPSSSILYE